MTEDLYTLGLSLLGPLAKRPPAAQEIRIFIDKDTGITYVSNGTSWLSTGATFTDITGDGSGGLIVAGALTAGDSTAASVPSLNHVYGYFNPTDSPGNSVDGDPVQEIDQSSDVIGATAQEAFLVVRSGDISSHDYIRPSIRLRDLTASTQPMMTLEKQNVIQFQVDGDGTAFTSKIKATNHSVPTAAAGTNAGTTPPAPVLGAGANDTAGSLTFGTGTSPAAGAQVVLTFGIAYSTAPKAVIVTPTNAAAAAKGPFYATATTTTLTLGMNVAGAASQANTVYGLSYTVIQ